MFEAIGSSLKIILFFLSLWKERDTAKAARKAIVAKEIVDAFAETDKKLQASRLNAAIGAINRLR